MEGVGVGHCIHRIVSKFPMFKRLEQNPAAGCNGLHYTRTVSRNCE